jgi:hypothetical protein
MGRCRACKKWFHPRGYINHLEQTSNSECSAILAQSLRDSGLPDSDEDEEEEDLLYFGDEYWEEPVPAQTGMEVDIQDDEPGLGLGDDQQREHEVHQAREVRWAAEEEFRKVPVVVPFPSTKAGAPIANICAVPKYETYQKDLSDLNNPWAPFLSKLDWEVAKWAKLRGPSSTAFTELLKIDGVSAQICSMLYIVLTSVQVCERLELSYQSSQQLNTMIDSRLPQIPMFERQSVNMGGEAFEMHSRNVIDCIRYLFGDPEFAPHLLLVPERHFTDASKTNKVMHEMNSCRWWCNTQVRTRDK